jgi:hypothetical protein
MVGVKSISIALIAATSSSRIGTNASYSSTTGAPFHMAKIYRLIDDQDESVANGDRAFDFEAKRRFPKYCGQYIQSIPSAPVNEIVPDFKVRRRALPLCSFIE